jgi:hypothetical protein
MTREELIKKIQALRAMSNGSANLQEAATAARLAETIIQKHGLEEAELELSSGVKEEAHKDGIPVVLWGQKQNRWQNILLTHLCKAYNCEGILSFNGGDKLGFYAIGRPADISTLRYQFSYFHLEMTRLAKLLSPDDLARGSGKQWYNSFYLGATASIGEALRASKQEIRATASSTALAVIDNHAKEAKDLLRKLHPTAGMTSFKSNINHNAYEIGKAVGSNLNKNPGLPSGFRGLLNK